jgi:hypothetical protein
MQPSQSAGRGKQTDSRLNSSAARGGIRVDTASSTGVLSVAVHTCDSLPWLWRVALSH